MPRGRKAMINYDEELMKIDMQITKWKNTILELQDRRKELSEEKERMELSNLYRTIQSSGRSISEVTALLQSVPGGQSLSEAGA